MSFIFRPMARNEARYPLNRWQCGSNSLDDRRLRRAATDATFPLSCTCQVNNGRWKGWAVGVRIYGLHNRGIAVHFPAAIRPKSGPIQPPFKWVPWALTPGLREPWLRLDHSPSWAFSIGFGAGRASPTPPQKKNKRGTQPEPPARMSWSRSQAVTSL